MTKTAKIIEQVPDPEAFAAWYKHIRARMTVVHVESVEIRIDSKGAAAFLR